MLLEVKSDAASLMGAACLLCPSSASFRAPDGRRPGVELPSLESAPISAYPRPVAFCPTAAIVRFAKKREKKKKVPSSRAVRIKTKGLHRETARGGRQRHGGGWHGQPSAACLRAVVPRPDWQCPLPLVGGEPAAGCARHGPGTASRWAPPRFVLRLGASSSLEAHLLRPVLRS